MFNLANNLAIIFGVQIFVGNAVKYCIPLWMYARKRHAQKLVSEEDYEALTQLEKDYLLNTYDNLGTSIRNYTTIIIQFGYMYSRNKIIL